MPCKRPKKFTLQLSMSNARDIEPPDKRPQDQEIKSSIDKRLAIRRSFSGVLPVPEVAAGIQGNIRSSVIRSGTIRGLADYVVL